MKLIVVMSLSLTIVAFMVALKVCEVGLIEDCNRNLKYIFRLIC
jgi:hypothetical protein